jgi:hypothetical protein
MLFRRYNAPRWSYGSKRTLVDGEPCEWTELLPDAPRLYYDDICFVLWDFYPGRRAETSPPTRCKGL